MFSPWKVFPHFVTLHHSDREEQIVRRGGGTLRHSEREEVPSPQRKSRGLWSFLSWLSEGGSALSILAAQTFWEVKSDTCFYKVRVMIHTIFHALEEEEHRETLRSSNAYFIFMDPIVPF